MSGPEKTGQNVTGRECSTAERSAVAGTSPPRQPPRAAYPYGRKRSAEAFGRVRWGPRASAKLAARRGRPDTQQAP